MVAYWLTLALLAVSWRAIDACSCMPEHPQTHYCRSDFVIIARVEGVKHLPNYRDAYRIRLRRAVKATEKAAVALRYRQIYVPSQESLCGVSLQLNETYVLTGKVVQLQAHVSLCNYHAKWREFTSVQKRRFRRYQDGCSCKVRVSWTKPAKSSHPNTCISGFDDCYERHGVCVQNNKGKCRWRNSGYLQRCLHSQYYNGTMT